MRSTGADFLHLFKYPYLAEGKSCQGPIRKTCEVHKAWVVCLLPDCRCEVSRAWNRMMEISWNLSEVSFLLCHCVTSLMWKHFFASDMLCLSGSPFAATYATIEIWTKALRIHGGADGMAMESWNHGAMETDGFCMAFERQRLLRFQTTALVPTLRVSCPKEQSGFWRAKVVRSTMWYQMDPRRKHFPPWCRHDEMIRFECWL